MHPRPSADFQEWYDGLLTGPATIVIPEIVDYELRRELIRLGNVESTDRLSGLAQVFRYAPITTAIMRRAAELWADSRREGRPTADPRELDVDVILAATAQSLQEEDEVLVATTNLVHLSRFVPAAHWRDINP
ncbi:MAG: PIN domain-containing protein [Dehalococcoidia bacterium]